MSVTHCDARTEDLAARRVGSILADKCFKLYADWVEMDDCREKDLPEHPFEI